MDIISIVASPHGLKGNTARLLSLVLEGAEAEGATNETIILPGHSVLPCLACDTCHRKGKCPQDDEFESIRGKILESDGVVLASPNYIFMCYGTSICKLVTHTGETIVRSGAILIENSY